MSRLKFRVFLLLKSLLITNNSVKSSPLNVTITDFLWPQLRSTVANYLINQENFDIETAYNEVFRRIPPSGNCFCHEERERVSHGKPQDLYDAACKRYHSCLYCGLFKQDEAEFEGYAIDADLTIDFEEIEIVDAPLGLTELVAENYMLNYNSSTNKLTINIWNCDDNQDSASLSVCKGFERLQNEFIDIAMDEIRNSFADGYSSECARTVGNCPDCLENGVPEDLEYDEIIRERGIIDSCCGESPGWVSYSSENYECCGGEFVMERDGTCDVTTLQPTTVGEELITDGVTEGPTTEALVETTSEVATEPTTQPITTEQTTQQTTTPTTVEPTTETEAETTLEVTTELTTEPMIAEPTTEPATEPTADPETEPTTIITQPIIETTIEVTTEPTTQLTTQSTTQQTSTSTIVELTTETLVMTSLEVTTEPATEPMITRAGAVLLAYDDIVSR